MFYQPALINFGKCEGLIYKSNILFFPKIGKKGKRIKRKHDDLIV